VVAGRALDDILHVRDDEVFGGAEAGESGSGGLRIAVALERCWLLFKLFGLFEGVDGFERRRWAH
jgi:hypothetical protein